jgi:hypothetical protein
MFQWRNAISVHDDTDSEEVAREDERSQQRDQAIRPALAEGNLAVALQVLLGMGGDRRAEVPQAPDRPTTADEGDELASAME